MRGQRVPRMASATLISSVPIIDIHCCYFLSLAGCNSRFAHANRHCSEHPYVSLERIFPTDQPKPKHSNCKPGTTLVHPQFNHFYLIISFKSCFQFSFFSFFHFDAFFNFKINLQNFETK